MVTCSDTTYRVVVVELRMPCGDVIGSVPCGAIDDQSMPCGAVMRYKMTVVSLRSIGRGVTMHE